MKKTSKKTNAQLGKLVWKEIGRLNRKINPPICYTCGAQNLEGSNWHPGHGKPKAELPMKAKYDFRNIKSQCIRCNIHMGGKTDVFITKLEKEKNGLDFLNEFCVKIDGYWEIKHTPTMGSTESWMYLYTLLEDLKKL